MKLALALIITPINGRTRAMQKTNPNRKAVYYKSKIRRNKANFESTKCQVKMWLKSSVTPAPIHAETKDMQTTKPTREVPFYSSSAGEPKT